MYKTFIKIFFALSCCIMTVFPRTATAGTCASNQYYSLSKKKCLSCPSNAKCDGSNYTCVAGYQAAILYKGSSSEQLGCEICSAGTYSPSTSNLCSKCDVGTYASGKGSSKCTPCPAGTYSDIKGRAQCLNCLIGTYTDKTGQSKCLKCGDGKYQPSQGQTSCLSVPEHATAIGASDIFGNYTFKCNDGYYQIGTTCSSTPPTSPGGRYGFIMTDPYATTPAPAQDFQIIQNHPGYSSIPAELKKYCKDNGSQYSFGYEVVCDFPVSSGYFWSSSNCMQYLKNRNNDDVGRQCSEVKNVSGVSLSGVFPKLYTPNCKEPWEVNWDGFEKMDYDYVKFMATSEPLCIRKTLYTVIDTAGQNGESEYMNFIRKPSEMAYKLQNDGMGTCIGLSNPDTVTCTCPEKRFNGIDRCYTYIENKSMSKSAVCELVKYVGCSGKIECQGDYEWNPETKVCAKEASLLLKDASMIYPETNATWNLTDWDARYSIKESYEKNALMASCDVSNSKITCLCPEKQFLSPAHCEKYQSAQNDSGIIGSCVVGGASGICYTKYNRCPAGCKKCMKSESVCDECLPGYAKNSEGKCLNQISGNCPSPLKKSADGCCCVK